MFLAVNRAEAGKPPPMTGHVMVFAPEPQLTVTVERRGDGDEIHLHPGGQGVWQARMINSLGCPVVLCASLGGEVGRVLEPLIAAEGITVRSIAAGSRNGAYVHDRRSGKRLDIAEVPGDTLSRHELDELYGLTLAEGLVAEVCVLSGAAHAAVAPPDVYRRLSADLRRNGRRVVADLSGEHLSAVLSGKPDVVKVSHEDLGISDDVESLTHAACSLREAGANTVVVTRAERPAVALLEETIYEVVTPTLEPADPRGAGDSLTAGLVATLAGGGAIDEAVQAGAAAGALNVTRHGLGTGEAGAVARLRERVRLVPIGRRAPQGEEHSDAPDIRATPSELAHRVDVP
jgi:1-phosphofructokinase